MKEESSVDSLKCHITVEKCCIPSIAFYRNGSTMSRCSFYTCQTQYHSMSVIKIAVFIPEGSKPFPVHFTLNPMMLTVQNYVYAEPFNLDRKAFRRVVLIRV